MSSRKDKILESAQKFIAKGQIDKAIKDYQQVIAIDPADIRHRQRLAELYVKVAMKAEAITEYGVIGKYYADNSYFLKAIAVYKQIQKLNPDDVTTTLMLGELNAKQGLVGNALAEFSTAFSYYEKNDNKADALKVLEQMLAVDPENLNTQLRFAETHFALGMVEKAYDEFTQLAHLLQKRGDESAFNGVSSRIQQLFPEKKDFLLDLLAAQIAKGGGRQCIPRLKEILTADKQNQRAWTLLLEALQGAGDKAGMLAASQQMVAIFPKLPEPRLVIIEEAVATGNRDDALIELRKHFAPLLANGLLAQLERYFESLLNINPDDSEVLQGFANLYESAGESAKLAGIKARLEQLTRQSAVEDSSPPIEELQVASTEPVEVAAAEEEETAPQSAPEPEWEEEIELSLVEEGEESDQQSESTLTPAAEPELPAEHALSDDEMLEVKSSALVAEPEVATDSEDSRQPEDGYVFLEVETGPEITALLIANMEQTADRSDAEVVPTGEELDLDLDDDSGEPLDLGEELFSPEYVAESPAENATATVQEDIQTAPDGADSGNNEPLFGDDDLLDFGAELFPEEPQTHQAKVVATEKYSLDGLFSQFKDGLDRQVEKGDTETHFDLGIAYKEMGLYDDAIAEFQVAAADPHRQVDCLTLQGLCYQEKGNFAQAEAVFNKALALADLPQEGLLSINYELGQLYEMSGRTAEAISIFTNVCKIDPDYRDVSTKLVNLGGAASGVDLEEVELVEVDAD